MKRYWMLALAAAILVAVPFTLMAMSHGSGSKGTETAAEEFDLKAAEMTFEDYCSKCHTIKRPLNKSKDREGWEKTVGRMASYHKRQMGGPIPEEDQAAIVQYLLEVAGK